MFCDYIIVGQGLAGSLMAHRLLQHQQRIMVVDEGLNHTSSKIAAGMFTPLSGKRLAKSWMADELIGEAEITYAEMEELFKQSFITHQPIQISFSSVKEQNDFYGAQHANIAQYLQTDVTMHNGLQAPYGGFEVLKSGWLNTTGLLKAIKDNLVSKHLYLNEAFDYAQLTPTDSGWQYKNIYSKGIVFCEGYKNANNPFFKHIPIIANKGDVFQLQTSCLDGLKIYKRGAYAVCLGPTQFKVGSTYHWDNDHEQPNEKGYAELQQKVNQLLQGDYEVKQHLAGIRPTTKDRRPVLGQHQNHQGLYLFNGLGTKGVMLAPYFSKVMADFILLNKQLPKEVNLTRFTT